MYSLRRAKAFLGSISTRIFCYKCASAVEYSAMEIVFIFIRLPALTTGVEERQGDPSLVKGRESEGVMTR